MNNNNHKVNVMYSYVQSYSIYYKICLNIPPMTWKSMLKMKWCKWSIGKESFQLTPPPPKKKKHSSASTKIHSSRIQPVHEYLQHKNFFTQIRIFPLKKIRGIGFGKPKQMPPISMKKMCSHDRIPSKFIIF